MSGQSPERHCHCPETRRTLQQSSEEVLLVTVIHVQSVHIYKDISYLGLRPQRFATDKDSQTSALPTSLFFSHCRPSDAPPTSGNPLVDGHSGALDSSRDLYACTGTSASDADRQWRLILHNTTLPINVASHANSATKMPSQLHVRSFVPVVALLRPYFY